MAKNAKQDLFLKNLKSMADDNNRKKEAAAKKAKKEAENRKKAAAAKAQAEKSQHVSVTDKRMAAKDASWGNTHNVKAPKKSPSVKKNQSTGASKYKKPLPKVKDTTYTMKAEKPPKKPVSKLDAEIAQAYGKKTGPVTQRLDDETQYMIDKKFAESTAGRVVDASMESFLNNTIGVPYQIVKGEKLFKPTQAMIDTGGTDTMAYKVGDLIGNVAAFALPYGAAGKAMGKAADVVMKTRLAQQAIGKAGQKIGTEVAGKVAREAVKDFIGDSTIGLVQNVAMARGEGLEGEELVGDVIKNQAFDYALGGAIDAIPAVKKAVSPKYAAWKESRAAAKAEKQAAQEVAEEATERVVKEETEQVAKVAEKQVSEPEIDVPETDNAGKIIGEEVKYSGGSRDSVRKVPKTPPKPKKKHFEQVREVKEAVGIHVGIHKYGDAKSINDGYSDLVSKAKKGTLTDEDIEDFAEYILDEARVIDASGEEFYKEIKNDIRHTPLRISDKMRSNIPDWNDFRKAHFGSLKLTKDGFPVDSFYLELQDMYPGILPEVNSVEEMVENLANVAKRSYTKEMHLFDSDNYTEQDIEDTFNSTVRILKEYLGEITAQYNPRVITRQEMKANLRPAAKKANGIPEAHETVGGFDVDSSNIGIVNPDLKAINDMMDSGNSVFDSFYKAAVSGQKELEKLSKAAGNTKVDDYTQAVRNGQGTVSYIFDKGLVDSTGKVINNVSYKDLIGAIPKKLRKDFNTYAQHLHNIDRIREGKPVFRQYSAEESKAIVDEMLAKHPEFKQYTENINKWWTEFIQAWLVDTGRVSQEAFDSMRKMYPNYIPTYRVDKKNGGGGLANRIGVGSGIKKAVGGESEIIPLEDKFLERMEKIVKDTKKNDLYLSIIDDLGSNPEKLKHFGVKTTDKDVLSNNALDDLLNEVESTGLKQVKDNTYMLTAYKDGAPVSAYVNKDIVEALNLLDDAYGSVAMRRFADIGKKVSDPMKAVITGYNPVFILSNIVRDLPTLYIQSQHGMFKTTTGIGKSIKQILTNGDMLQKYAALGGKRSGYYAQGKGFEKALENSSGIGKVKQGVESLLSSLGEGAETIPRLAEFINSVEKYGDTKDGIMRALKDAGEVTVNFSRSAPVTKTLDAWTVYLNAAVQGLDKFARTIKTRPLKTVGRSATMITLPYAALMALNWENPHYHDLNERTKQNYFLIPNITGETDAQGNAMTFIKLPLNREYGVMLGSSLDVVAGYITGEENPWKGFSETVKTNFTPPNPVTDNILSPFMINLPNNKDFAGRAIVPQSLENASPINQSDSTTSRAAKAVANLANKMPVAPDVFKSPKKVDYLLDTYGGYYGQVLQGATSKDSINIPTTAKNTVSDPFVQRFTADPRYSSGVVADFYDKLDAAETEKIDDALDGKDYSEGKAKYKAYNEVAREMSELTRQEKQILKSNLPKDQKDKEVKKLRQKKNALARGAEKKAEAAAKEYRNAPTFAALDKDVKAKYKPKSGVNKETWGKAYNNQTKLDSSAAKTLAIINSGVTDYENAKTISSRVTEASMKKAIALKDANIKPSDFDKTAKKINKNKDSYYSVDEITSYLNSTNKYTRLQKRVIFSVLTNAKSNPY